MTDDKIIYYGTVIFMDIRKGYGFIAWDKEGEKQKDIFVHFSDILCDGFKAVYKDQKVSFTLGFNVRGDLKATNITVLKN